MNNWIKYQLNFEQISQNQHLNHLINQNFQGGNVLFCVII